MRDCAVILVNYRQPALTEQTVASLRKADGFVRLAVYVIDNGSGDGSYERLRKSCADCIVLSTGSNLGFSGGNNVGVRAALESGVKWVLLLNNDTEVEPKFLEPLMSAVSDGRSLATARIVYASDPKRLWYGGGFIDRRRGGFYHETDDALATVPRPVEFASGCCLLMPAEFLTKHGLLDESYFLYYEDAELCLRAAECGYVIRYVPQSVVRHHVSASTGGEESDLSVYYGTRNRLMLLSRAGFPLRAKIFVVVSRLVKIVRAPFRRSLWQAVPGVGDWLRGRTGRKEALG